MTSMIEVGEQAPDFTLEASDGKQYTLSEVLAGSRALLIFYPGNNTPG
jgi:peroxiredoxin